MTTDPASNDTIPDSTGAVASDSLAAESANSGGAFSANSGAPQKVSGSNSTFNNTNTSGATTLEPTPNKSARDDAPEGSEGTAGLKYPEGVGGQGNFPGQHNADGYAGGPTSAKKAMGVRSGGFHQKSTGSDQSHGQFSQSEGQVRSSSKLEVSEGAFDSNPENNASFTSEIGSENDPGRQAIGDMQKKAQSASGGTGPRQPVGQEGTGPYDALSSEEQV